jgi:hypothetical protein
VGVDVREFKACLVELEARLPHDHSLSCFHLLRKLVMGSFHLNLLLTSFLLCNDAMPSLHKDSTIGG